MLSTLRFTMVLAACGALLGTSPALAESPTVGDPAPAFSLMDQNGNTQSLEQYRGQWVAVYFYPKDDTSGCTKEAIAFTELLPEFEKIDAAIIGISPDSAESHDKFIAKRTEGALEFLEHIKDKTPEWAEGICGVPAADIEKTAIL